MKHTENDKSPDGAPSALNAGLGITISELQGFLDDAYAEIARLNNIIQQPPIGADLPQPVLCESCKAIGAAYRIGVEKISEAQILLNAANHIETKFDSQHKSMYGVQYAVIELRRMAVPN